MANSFHIRKAQLSDVEQIQEVYIEASKTSISHYNVEQVEAIIDNFTIEALEKKLKTNDANVIEVEGKIVAYSLADLEKKWVWAVFVLPAYQGKGYGKILVEKIDEFFQKNDVKEFGLYARKGAVDFYKKYSFTEIATDFIWTLANGKQVYLSTMKKII